jgi:hypothetical protein
MIHEEDELSVLRARMAYLGKYDYEVRDRMVYWQGQRIGTLSEVNAISMERVAELLDDVRRQAKGEKQG